MAEVSVASGDNFRESRLGSLSTRLQVSTRAMLAWAELQFRCAIWRIFAVKSITPMCKILL